MTKNKCSIKVIGFDLDDTLWPLAETIKLANQKTWKFLCSEHPAILEKFSSDYASPTLNTLPIFKQFKHKITRARFAIIEHMLLNTGASNAQARQIASRAIDLFLDYRHRLTFYPGALACLKSLKKEFKLASISNGNADVKRIKPLHKIFDFSINAEDINSSKPEPDLFVAALNFFNIKPQEMLYVGDHIIKDVLAAKAINMHAIWFNWEGDKKTKTQELASLLDAMPTNKKLQSPQALLQAKNFNELKQLIDTL